MSSSEDQPTRPLGREDLNAGPAQADEFESGFDYAAFAEQDEEAESSTENTSDTENNSDSENSDRSYFAEDAEDSDSEQQAAQKTRPIPNFLKDPQEPADQAQNENSDTANRTTVLPDLPDEYANSSSQQGQPYQQDQQNNRYQQTTVLPDLPESETSGSEGSEHEEYDESPEAVASRKDRREAEARLAARDEAFETPRTASRVLQVLLAIFAPIVALVAIIRLVASPAFLWAAYHRPGFPEDQYGFSTDDRMTYGAYGMDYVTNLSPRRYLGETTDASGAPLFTDAEVDHMHDVKIVLLIALAAAVVLAIACVVFMVILAKNHKGAIRRALFSGSVGLLVVMLGLAVLAVTGWDAFFAGFHSVFFSDGTWTFYASDTLIRLYPNQFWLDAGLTIAGLALLSAVVTLVWTWPTKRRREDAKQAQLFAQERRSYWRDEDLSS